MWLLPFGSVPFVSDWYSHRCVDVFAVILHLNLSIKNAAFIAIALELYISYEGIFRIPSASSSSNPNIAELKRVFILDFYHSPVIYGHLKEILQENVYFKNCVLNSDGTLPSLLAYCFRTILCQVFVEIPPNLERSFLHNPSPPICVSMTSCLCCLCGPL